MTLWPWERNVCGTATKMWVAAQKLPRSPGHPFYERLNRVLEKARLRRLCGGTVRAVLRRRDRAAESAPRTVLPDAVVGVLRRAELGTGHRLAVADSMSVRAFLDLDPEETPPNHSTLSRDAAPDRPGDARGGVPLGADAAGGGGTGAGEDDRNRRHDVGTNAAMRSLVRRDTGKTMRRS